MPAFDVVLAQARQLPDDKRGKVVARLLRSLEPASEVLTDEEWEAAWAVELDARVREIRAGEVELTDGDEARTRVRAAIDAVRP